MAGTVSRSAVPLLSAEQPGIGISGGAMRVILVLLAMEAALGTRREVLSAVAVA